MSLLNRLTEELKEALRAGNHTKLSVIRLLKSSIKNREIEKMAPLTDEEVIDIHDRPQTEKRIDRAVSKRGKRGFSPEGEERAGGITDIFATTT